MKIRSLCMGMIGAMAISSPAFAQQFPDVSPTNWAYQAILSLRDKYGVARGFPDGTFRAGQPATRAELAALTNAVLDEITAYSDEKDAALAAALRAEIASVGNRVTVLEQEAARKSASVGNYVGGGLTLTNQGVSGNGFSAERTIAGGTLQGRLALANVGSRNAISVRPYVNFAAGPDSQIGAAGGALATFDLSIGKSEGVSSANLYTGVGYQVPFVNGTLSNYQSSIGTEGQVMLVLGGEARLSPSVTMFTDIKFPTTTSAYSVDGSNGTYSPVYTLGAGFKL